MAASSLRLTRLRSQLLHISSEFDNLTVAELQQMRFALQQRVFLEIAMYSPRLRSEDLCARCAELIEKAQRTGRHLGKEQRAETERETRLRFMALVQEALVMLSWPPACEPFADILTPLMSDRVFFLSAVEFMLSTVMPAPVPIDSHRRATSHASTKMNPANQRKPSMPHEGAQLSITEESTPAQSKIAVAEKPRAEPTTLHDELSQQKYDALKASFLVKPC